MLTVCGSQTRRFVALRLENAEQLPGNSVFILRFAPGLLCNLHWQVECHTIMVLFFFLRLLLLGILEWF